MQTMISAKARIVQTVAVLCAMAVLTLLILPSATPQLAYSLYTMKNDEMQPPYFVTRIHIWNAGRTAVSGDSSPVRIAFPDATDMFFFQIRDRPMPEGFELEKPDADGNARLFFDEIAPGGGVTVAAYSYAPPVVMLTADVSGNPGPGIVQKKDPSPLLTDAFTAFTLLLPIFCLYSLIRQIVRVRREIAGAEPLPRFWPLPIRTKPVYHRPRASRFARFFRRYWPVSWGIIWVICWILLYV